MRLESFFLSLVLCIIISSVSHCKKNPGDYIRKAREALEDENTSKAVFYFQKAYESSLSDRFFLLSRDTQFSQIEVSNSRRHLVLVQPSDKKSKFVYKVLHRNGDSEEIWENVKGVIKHSHISSNGKYVLFVVSQLIVETDEQLCKLIIWKASKNEFIEIIRNLNCENRPAVSSQAEVLFMKKNEIWFWRRSGLPNGKRELWVNKTPDKPFKHQKAKAFFSFSAKNSPFMTYGTAGTYKLYALAHHNLQLLTKKSSYYKIFFMPKSPNPGVITGGASQQKFTFFHPRYHNQIIKEYSISVLKDISFVNENEYYFIESERLYQTKEGKSIALPFFAKNIFVNDRGGVFFLSSIGTFLHYEGILPNKLSQNIFTKTLDIEESK